MEQSYRVVMFLVKTSYKVSFSSGENSLRNINQKLLNQVGAKETQIVILLRKNSSKVFLL